MDLTRIIATVHLSGSPSKESNRFNAPSDVVVSDNGSVFVADGHANTTNNRIVKFGLMVPTFKEWGGDRLAKRINSLPVGYPRSTIGSGAEFVAVDGGGNVCGGKPVPQNL